MEFELKKALRYVKKTPIESSSIENGIKFVAEDSLNSAIIEIINNADSFVTLIAPYIKLHERVKDALNLKVQIKNFDLIILYGKSFDGINKNDRAFLKKFKKLKIRYKERLHAKCYFNSKKVLLTSMNLYDFSQNNNIEFGIVIEKSSSPKLYEETVSYFKKVLKNSKTV
jgi:phosphatidylserine/phosphatidylglycerophosphate/cardiolipin synthase-like enzyme